jgi:hypothetical protein
VDAVKHARRAAARRPVAAVLRGHHVHHQGRHQGARQQVGGQHREDHRLGQRHEQRAGHAGEEEHRHEDDADAQGRHEGRHGDFLGPVENGLVGVLAQRHLALDVLDLDGGVVHQDAHRQRQAAEGHQVEGFAQQKKHDQRADRQRDGHRDDAGGAPVAQNSRIIAAVSEAAIRASWSTLPMAARTNSDWSNISLTFMSSGSFSRMRGISLAPGPPPAWTRRHLEHRGQDAALPFCRTMVVAARRRRARWPRRAWMVLPRRS